VVIQENERLKAQVAITRDALEEATETIENMYGHDIPQTLKYRDTLNSVDIDYHNPSDIAKLEAREMEIEQLKSDNMNFDMNLSHMTDKVDEQAERIEKQQKDNEMLLNNISRLGRKLDALVSDKDLQTERIRRMGEALRESQSYFVRYRKVYGSIGAEAIAEKIDDLLGGVGDEKA
jgi:chromosome segregation ATPase